MSQSGPLVAGSTHKHLTGLCQNCFEKWLGADQATMLTEITGYNRYFGIFSGFVNYHCKHDNTLNNLILEPIFRRLTSSKDLHGRIVYPKGTLINMAASVAN